VGSQKGWVAHLVQLSGVERGGLGRVITPFCMEGPDMNSPLDSSRTLLFHDALL